MTNGMVFALIGAALAALMAGIGSAKGVDQRYAALFFFFDFFKR